MKPRGYFLLGSAIAVLGCVEGKLEPGETGPEPGTAGRPNGGETGITISSVLAANIETDVKFMQIKINRVACAGGAMEEEMEPLTRDIRVELQRLQLPGGITAFEANPLDSKSQHQFADHFEVVPAGCYDITAAPLSGEANASESCAPAKASQILVVDGDTTEIILVSQCKGPEIGAVDAVVAINQPPQLVNVTYNPSKFIEAGSTTTVCATALDPNGDPLEFEWEELGGLLTGEVASTEEGADGTTQCAEISPTEEGGYMFEVRIFDMVRDEVANLVRVERWLADHGTPNLSHDSLLFPVYAGKAAAEPEEEHEEEQPPEEPQPPVGG